MLPVSMDGMVYVDSVSSPSSPSGNDGAPAPATNGIVMQKVNVGAIKRNAECGLASVAITLEMCNEIEELAGNYNEALSVIDDTVKSLDAILDLPNTGATVGETMRAAVRIKMRLMAAQLRLDPYNLGENRE